MVARWLLGIALSIQVTFAIAADPVRKNWNTHLKNQYNYDQRTQRAAAEVRADIKMGAPDSSERTSVKQMVERSISFADGSGGKIGASVTKSVDTGKVASTIAGRFKNAGQYAKNLGKASLPGFLGSAAFYGLMEGVDYVMDPENNQIVKKPSPDDPDPAAAQCAESNSNCSWSSNLYWIGNFEYLGKYPSLSAAAKAAAADRGCNGSITQNGQWWYCDGGMLGGGLSSKNADYKSDSTPPVADKIFATPEEIQEALKRALESNNAALAAAIAEAIKAAYTQDNSEGQPKTTNPLVADAQNDMQRAVDGAIDTPTTTAGTAERPEGYYKITDGDKTIEGYVRPGDTSATGTTDSTTTPNPDGSSTTTGTASQQWPAFCDWAGIVCEFIDWVKEDEQLKEEKPDDIDDSIFSRKFDFDFKMSANCPPNPIWNFKFIDQSWSKEIDITMICDFFKYLGYAIVFSSNMTALWIVYAAVTVREQA